MIKHFFKTMLKLFVENIYKALIVKLVMYPWIYIIIVIAYCLMLRLTMPLFADEKSFCNCSAETLSRQHWCDYMQKYCHDNYPNPTHIGDLYKVKKDPLLKLDYPKFDAKLRYPDWNFLENDYNQIMYGRQLV